MILVLAILAAPIPQPRFNYRNEVTPGRYLISWARSSGQGVLNPDGTYSHMWSNTEYRGNWKWDSKTRILTLSEKSNAIQDKYYDFKFVLRHNTLFSTSHSIDGSTYNTGFFLIKNPKSIIINGCAKE